VTTPDARPPFARYRALLATHQFRPSRKLGQNFLLDPSMHRVMASQLAPTPSDLVIEIGAGLGFLTRALAATGARVLAVEIDRRLHAILEGERLADNVRLERGDALDHGRWSPWLLDAIEEERPPRGGRVLLVANLPYCISGPLLAELPALENPPAGVAVMVQFELAERLAARSGSAEYGAPSAILQAGYDLSLLRRVGSEVFRPRPAVGSAILGMQRRADAKIWQWPAGERGDFGSFVRAIFRSRRKKLRNALGNALSEEGPAAEMAGAWLEQRPGALSPAELLEIWRRVRGFA